jgi:hypothetical protein
MFVCIPVLAVVVVVVTAVGRAGRVNDGVDATTLEPCCFSNQFNSVKSVMA